VRVLQFTVPCSLSLVEVQAIPGFRTLDEDLRFTLLNLFQALSLKYWQESNTYHFDDTRIFGLEVICQWLAIVQDQTPLKIRGFVGFLLQGF
jgi:hypothetical protein